MVSRVLIIGGYGNFGSFIARRLADDENIQVIVAGRSLAKAQGMVRSLDAVHPAEAVALDIFVSLKEQLVTLSVDIVIHTSGPYQAQDYFVAKACIDVGCHYIDLADGREFVAGVGELDQAARAKGVLVVSGASSVPCLTSAVIDHYKPEFARLDRVDFGISTAQRTNRGLATTASILSYTGKPFDTLIDGNMTKVFGWQDLHTRKFPNLGRRFLSNCNVPDLALFPDRYRDLKTIRFYAGIEIPVVHVGLWMFAAAVRVGLIRGLERAAAPLLKVSRLFDWMGSDVSAFYLTLSGTSRRGARKDLTFDLIARSGDGPFIPCTPAILLAIKLAKAELTLQGAMACLDLITLDEYLDALGPLDIEWQVNEFEPV